jgi:hypothetical protein
MKIVALISLVLMLLPMFGCASQFQPQEPSRAATEKPEEQRPKSAIPTFPIVLANKRLAKRRDLESRQFTRKNRLYSLFVSVWQAYAAGPASIIFCLEITETVSALVGPAVTIAFTSTPSAL